MRRQRVEAELLDELAKQQVVRKERELVELHAKRQSRAQEEETEREAKGEHEVSMMGRGLRVVPKFLYKARAAQLRLNTLQLLDMSSNKLVALPRNGVFLPHGLSSETRCFPQSFANAAKGNQ